jgi:single-strand DNA-binding protein
LATNVRQSVTVGDALIVTGRLFTRDWEDENSVKRTAYELEAMAVGHDLSRGRAVFERVKPRTSTSAIEDAEAAQRVAGGLTDPVPDDEAPVQFDDTPFDAIIDQPAAAPGLPVDGYGESAAVPDGGDHTRDEVTDPRDGAAPAGLSPVGDGDETDPGPVDEPEEPAATRRRGGRRAKVPA